MRQFKVVVGVLGVSSCFITSLLYYWYRSSLADHRNLKINDPQEVTTDMNGPEKLGTPFSHKALNEIYKDRYVDYSLELEDRKPVTLINTPGCQIPLAMINYEKFSKKTKNNNSSCGRRAVFLKKTDGDTVQALIKPHIIKTYLRKSILFNCCYRFLRRSDRPGHDNKIKYTKCKKLQDGDTISLESDFINVKCFEYEKRNTSHIVYDDVYAFTKKINILKPDQTNCKEKYNVLMVGMDSMSLPRFANTMSRTIGFFSDNFWLGYRGYHKVGDNTFPNLMAAFTGRNVSTIAEKCAGRMDKCNDMLIWSKFKDAGYTTAYGEDYLRLPDTFNKNYAFHKAPTDHYMRPLFLRGEHEVNNKSLVCAGKSPSGQQLLDYALDFALTYRRDSFFGIFWMNSFSHNVNSRPSDSDKMFENFFNRLTYTGVLANTFVIFFSDHGIRFGEPRLTIESYYDERLPSLFLLIPMMFKEKHPEEFKAAAINQFRLLTPYDLYNTLVQIHAVSVCSNSAGSVSEACPNCQSIFNVIDGNRTCRDVAIQDKWCSCHKLYPLDILDAKGLKSVQFAVSYIKSMIRSVKTKRCWSCVNLSLQNIIRIHFYYNKHKTGLYHVVAFAMSPGNVSYEATVVRKSGIKNEELVGSVSVISPYRGLGKCTMEPKDRLFCVCQKMENCRINS